MSKRRFMKTRAEDSTFQVNLAPLLDIIVSIIPMLLLSVVFVQINEIQTRLPASIQEAIDDQKEGPNEPSVKLHMKKDAGFEFVVTSGGKTENAKVALKDGKLDYSELTKQAVRIKRAHPQIFQLDLVPDETVKLDEIVVLMDKLRKAEKSEAKFSYLDKKTGKTETTDFLFPKVVFSNVMGD